MSVKVFIDGSSGTTGLRIADRLAARPDIELLSISAEGRKDVNERAKVINSADLAFLCLPDAASKEVMPLLRPDVKVLDTSTAFRTDAAWDYGFPELKGQKEKIKNSCRVAVPGCYASGFISIARPLVELGLAPADYPFSCTGISGYSGGGKKMIAEYESADRPAHSKLDAPKSYGLGLAHKHLPEMQKISGLAHTPAFVPVVCDYYSGMQVLVPFDLKLAGTSAEAVAAGIAEYYKEGATVSVHALNEALPENGLYSNALSGSDRMELYMTVNAAGDQMMLVSLFDNLGKGSSGAAIQCMNLMLGMDETEGLNKKGLALSGACAPDPPKGEPKASPFGRGGTAEAVTERARMLYRGIFRCSIKKLRAASARPRVLQRPVSIAASGRITVKNTIWHSSRPTSAAPQPVSTPPTRSAAHPSRWTAPT